MGEKKGVSPVEKNCHTPNPKSTAAQTALTITRTVALAFSSENLELNSLVWS
jgi:hypothetical protein